MTQTSCRHVTKAFISIPYGANSIALKTQRQSWDTSCFWWDHCGSWTVTVCKLYAITMNARRLPWSSIRSSSNCLSTAVIASNLDSRLLSRNHDGVARLEDKLVYPQPSLPRPTVDGYSWTHNPPSGPGDSRHVRGSASAISSRIKTGSCNVKRAQRESEETTEKRTERKQKLCTWEETR